MQLPVAWKIGRSQISLINRPSAAAIRSPSYLAPSLKEALAEDFPPDYRTHLKFDLGRCREHRCRTPEPRRAVPGRIWNRPPHHQRAPATVSGLGRRGDVEDRRPNGAAAI